MMNNIKLISVIIIMSLMFSCSITKKIEKNIVGKWEITSLKYLNEASLSEEHNEMYEVLIKELLKDSYFEFNEDKTYELYLLDESFKDSWSISEDGSKILSSDTDKYFKIISKTEDTMVLKSINDTDEVLINLKKL